MGLRKEVFNLCLLLDHVCSLERFLTVKPVNNRHDVLYDKLSQVCQTVKMTTIIEPIVRAYTSSRRTVSF